MKRVSTAVSCAVLLAAGGMSAYGENLLAKHERLELRAAKANLENVPRYGTLELKVDLGATYDNPFDPEQIDLHAVFFSPQGQQVRVNGFLDQPFRRRLDNGSEKIESAGEPVWEIRFTPNSAGSWKYKVEATDRSGTVTLPEGKFQVSESTRPGFIRRAEKNPFGFATEDGKPFFAVGENVCWGNRRGSFDFEDWLPSLGKAGGNFIRIWMSSWNCALEWSQAGKGEWRSGSYYGVGVYSLDNAWKLDAILDLAEQNGISVMLCLGTYGEFKEGGYFNEGQWKANSYNAANGGPCTKPEEFWTDPAARKLYQRRLRYLAARYGHRTNLHSWEFWNETEAPAAWVGEMARWMKGTGEFGGHPADPYLHLLTTTYGHEAVWNLPEIDYTQTHSYGKGDVPDHAPVAHEDARKHVKFGKPHLLGEFGIDWRGPDTKYDTEGKGIDLHNALWAAAASGDAGGGMIWWWDSYVHPKNLYREFGALRRFADTVPWSRGEWKTLSAEVKTPAGTEPPSPLPLHVYGLINGRTALAWFHNPQHHWKNAFEKKEIAPVSATEITLREIPAGTYQVEWWDTHKGEITRREVARGTAGELTLKVPALADDVAMKLDATTEKAEKLKAEN